MAYRKCWPNSEGEIVWQGQYSAWGHLQRQTRPTSTFNREQNLRFQGQYFDKDKFVGNKFEQRLRWPVGRVSGWYEYTGLHYNTFRYYASDLGRFTQQDPIGLAGGINLYAYAPNALTWVDPWGWSCGSDAKILRENMIERGIITPNYKNSAHHIIMSNAKDVRMRWLRRKMNRLGLI